MKKCLLFFLFYTASHVFGQIDAKARLSALSFLINGDIAGCSFYYPSSGEKGKCYFDFYCNRRAYSTDTLAELAQYWLTAILTYPLRDSVKYYDSMFIRFLSFDNSLKDEWVFAAPDRIPSTNEDDRLAALLGVLPFHAESAYKKDTIEISLVAIPGYSPVVNKTIYSNVLGFVVYDYVFKRRKNKIMIVSYVGKKIMSFYINQKAYHKVFSGS